MECNAPCCSLYALRAPTLKGYRIAILPVGSIEWHCGAPLGLDSLIAVRVAERLCEEVNRACGGAVLLPPLYYGASSEWSGYEELSIPRDTLPRLLTGLGMSLVRLGFKTLVVVNAHGGNSAAARLAAEELAFELGARLRVYILEWWRILGARLGHMDSLEAGLAAEALGVENVRICECTGLANPYNHVECREARGEPARGVWERLSEKMREVARRVCRGEPL